MSSENISFYARLKQTQELQHKRENKRLDLQKRFENYMMSDQNLSRLRANRLQSYWKKVCEDERKSKARNEQLLQDFVRVEAHIATLSSRTERLRLLKDQYERQVESMFPYWKEQMDIKRMSEAQKTNSAPMSFATPSQQYREQMNTLNMSQSIQQNGTSMISTPYQQPGSFDHVHLQGRPHSDLQVSPHPQQYTQFGATRQDSTLHRTPSTLPQSQAPQPTQVSDDGYEMPMVPGLHGTPRLQEAQIPNSHPSGQHPVVENRKSMPHGASQQMTYGQTEESSSFTVSSESPRSPQHQVRPVAGTVQPLQTSLAKDMTDASGKTLPGMEPLSQKMLLVGDASKEGQQVKSKEITKSAKSATNQFFTEEVVRGPSLGVGERLSSAQTEPFSSSDDSDDESKDPVDQALYSPELPPELPKYEEQARGPAINNKEQNQLPDQDGTEIPRAVKDEAEESSGSEEDSEIDSDVSLPLSEDKDKNDGPVPAQRHSIDPKAPEAESVKPNSIVLTTEGFYLLMKAVEAEIDATDSLEGIYATLACTRTIRDEIVRTANSNSGFDLLDPRAISMVILEELPLLVQKLPGGCLLSERLLVASSRTITELSIRSHMVSSSLKLWDDIHHHMVFLVRRGVMEPEGVAMKFAPLLLTADSQASEKAINVISDILMKAEEEEEVTFGEESSVSDSSHLNHTQSSPDVIRHAQPKDYPSVPPLSLGGMEGDTDDLVDTGRTSGDSFFDNKVPLNETSAYQRMMMSSQPEIQKQITGGNRSGNNDDEESESEDEIERATRINLESPSSQQTKKKRNVLSSLGGSLGRSLGSDDEEQERRPLPSDRTDEVSSPDKSDVTSSLSPTPRGGGGYVPSAMEHSMKSTGRTDTMNRSAAFWGNESDLDDESEMSVPMGTGKVDEEKDDFDFYD
ncbi:centrosomal protein kizuna-like isoform X1 [Lytechinus variegatus]|uniref:centrosomal protein kizuna-like isoform X1 n=1 Tax=Lytechinus variegatus TaxID=7654 RepID=UPI001BB2180E|nr:centrosomal protein kizuna-like isoform X1 [Lytechinus variegatus]